MHIDKTLYIFPTSRSIGSHLQKAHGLLHALTIREFYEKAQVCEGRIRVDEHTRFFLLKEAIEQVDIKRIGFSKHFLEFLEHSSFLFRFFDELFSEGVSFEQLRGFDFYAAFDEHIDILEKVHIAYKETLKKQGFYDPSFEPNLLLNTDYFSQFKAIVFQASGYLTQKELHLLQAIGQITPLTLHIRIDAHNANMLEKLAAIGLPNLTKGELSIDMHTQALLTHHKADKHSALIKVHPFSQRLSQGVYLFTLLEALTRRTEPENIAVVLLDESFAVFLKDLDFHHNLNFAMGKKFVTTALFKSIQAFVEEQTEALEQRIGVEPFLELLETTFAQEVDFAHLKETVFRFQTYHPLLSKNSAKEVAALFLETIKQIKLDDVKGGRIKVIGLLEARELQLDTAIILDFNRGTFPKSSQKDLFLNSEIKRGCGIPTPREREELQMHYLSELLRNTKQVHLLYTENNDALPSKFLDLIPHVKEYTDEEAMNKAFFGSKNYTLSTDDPIATLDFSRPFSHSSLKAYLTCRRQYYYRYIARIKEPQKDSLALTIGDRFHDYVKALGDRVPSSPQVLMDGLKTALLQPEDTKTALFNLELFWMACEDFCIAEYERRQEGFRPILFEEPFEVQIESIPFRGSIDRVDEKEGQHYLIDYKTGKTIKADSTRTLKNTIDFQLSIYRLGLEQKLGQSIEAAYFFDIRNGKLLKEEMIEEKTELLREKLKALKQPEQVFTRTEKRAPCRFCDYKILCGRD